MKIIINAFTREQALKKLNGIFDEYEKDFKFNINDMAYKVARSNNGIYKILELRIRRCNKGYNSPYVGKNMYMADCSGYAKDYWYEESTLYRTKDEAVFGYMKKMCDELIKILGK